MRHCAIGDVFFFARRAGRQAPMCSRPMGERHEFMLLGPPGAECFVLQHARADLRGLLPDAWEPRNCFSPHSRQPERNFSHFQQDEHARCYEATGPAHAHRWPTARAACCHPWALASVEPESEPRWKVYRGLLSPAGQNPAVTCWALERSLSNSYDERRSRAHQLPSTSSTAPRACPPEPAQKRGDWPDIRLHQPACRREQPLGNLDQRFAWGHHASAEGSDLPVKTLAVTKWNRAGGAGRWRGPTWWSQERNQLAGGIRGQRPPAAGHGLARWTIRAKNPHWLLARWVGIAVGLCAMRGASPPP
jgi:hypothetical protein